MATRVNVQYAANEDPRKFGRFTLRFQDSSGQEICRLLKFDFQPLWEFARDIESEAFDVLIMAMIVYNTDRVLNRYLYSTDGWRREICIEDIPAKNRLRMQQAKLQFEDAICFLTGDAWELNFVDAPDYHFEGEMHTDYELQEYKKVSLFSGGLDSLIGFVDSVSELTDGEKILLVSHTDLGKEASDQNHILEYCREHGLYSGKYEQLQFGVGIVRNHTGKKIAYESTFRSRSLLFFAAGIYVAHHISNEMPLIVPENGTISLNIPLDEGRRSACSTRTTHPTFMRKLQRAFVMVGIHNLLENPYRLQSKAEMVSECCTNEEKKEILRQLYPLSCSCAKRGHNRFWDKKGQQIHEDHITHCGMCLPCLYRRVALDAADWDNARYVGTDVLHGRDYNLNNRVQKRTWDFNALLGFISRRMNENVIRTELIINGIQDERELDEYTQLAMRSYEQVRAWVKKKAPQAISNRIPDAN